MGEVRGELLRTHGGKREGAGRKASGKVGKAYYLTLSPEATEKLKSIGRDKSEYIDRLILADISESITPNMGQRVRIEHPNTGWLSGVYAGCAITSVVGANAIIAHRVQLDNGVYVDFRDGDMPLEICQ